MMQRYEFISHPKPLTSMQNRLHHIHFVSHVDILHLNEQELVNITGIHLDGSPRYAEKDAAQIKNAISMFLKCGVAVVALTRGKKGSYIACSDAERFASTKML